MLLLSWKGGRNYRARHLVSGLDATRTECGIVIPRAIKTYEHLPKDGSRPPETCKTCWPEPAPVAA